MALDESIDENDKVVEVGGIRFIYNSGLTPYMDDLQIGYTDSWLGKGFKISHRGMKGGC